MDVEVWVLVDSDGQYWVSSEPDTLDEDHEAVHPTRMFKMVLKVPAPIHVELTATVPEESDGPITMTVK